MGDYEAMIYTNAATDATYTCESFMQVGTMWGFFINPVGTSGTTPSLTYPDGKQGAFVYKCSKLELTKDASALVQGDEVYTNATGEASSTSGGNTAIGYALAAAATNASPLVGLIDFDGRLAMFTS
jgi:predicted RecA/RadA family phage recombinase